MEEKRKIFISWSMSLAKGVAVAIKDSLQPIFPDADIFMSEKDIDVGTIPLEGIRGALDTSSCGLIVVTQENQFRPWLHFEAGSLLSRFDYQKNRVIPLLVDFETVGDLAASPLTQLQATLLDENGWEKIVCSLANAFGTDQGVRLRIARPMWSELRPKLDVLMAQARAANHEAPRKRGLDEKVDELLEITRSIRNFAGHSRPPYDRGLEGIVIYSSPKRFVLMDDRGYVAAFERDGEGSAYFLDPDDDTLPDELRQLIRKSCARHGVRWKLPSALQRRHLLPPGSNTGKLYLMEEAPEDSLPLPDIDF